MSTPIRLTKLAERGMVQASFVPPEPVRQPRGRTRTVFVQERTRHKHRVDKAVQDAQVKLSGPVSGRPPRRSSSPRSART